MGKHSGQGKKTDRVANKKGPHHGLFGKDENGDKHMWVILLCTAVAAAVICLYMCVLSGAYIARYPRKSGLQCIMMALADMGNWKMALSGFGKSATAGIAPLFMFLWVATVWVIYVAEDRNKLRVKDPKGNARWNDYKKYNRKFVWPKGKAEIAEPEENGTEIGNMIFSKNVRLNMNIRDTWLNDNVLIVGSPGSGKTRYVVKPNILQFNCSYAITDPSGELLQDIGSALQKHGYRIKVFNVSDMSHSQQYNPFRYIRKDEDVLSLVHCLMQNTDDSKSSKGDQFFTKSEECLLLAIFYYIYYYELPEKQNINTVMDMLQLAKVNEKNEDEESELDKMFRAIEESGPEGQESVAVRTYKTFKQGTGKTLKSILISVGVRMAPFNISAVRRLMSDDTLHLEEISDRKQALFIITKAEDSTYNFIAAMMYTQLFETQYARGAENASSWLLKKGCNVSLRSGVFKNSKQKEEEKKKLDKRRAEYLAATLHEEDPDDPKFLIEDEDGNLPVPRVWLEAADGSVLEEFQTRAEADLFMDCVKNGKVMVPKGLALPCHLRMILDEFANIGEIPGFLAKLTTMRKYSISCDIIIQSFGQIEEMYEKAYKTLIDGCSTRMYLALSNDDDLKTVSDSLGTRTIEVHNTSISYKGGESTSESMNKDSMPLMTPSEIRTMDPSMCLILVAGQDPFRDKKYVLEEHPNYHQTGDADDKNLFNYRQWFHIPGSSAKPVKDAVKKEEKESTGMPDPAQADPVTPFDADAPYAAVSTVDLVADVFGGFDAMDGRDGGSPDNAGPQVGDLQAEFL